MLNIIPVNKNILARLLLWLVVEIYLNCVGLDDLADYSEFVFEKHFTKLMSSIEFCINQNI